jgi:hypothetical protein
MATNLIKFPEDLGEGGEHHHYMVFRIYSNSSASLGGSSVPVAGEDSEFSSPENALLKDLDTSRDNKPDYSSTMNDANAGMLADIGSGIDAQVKAAKDANFSDTTYSRAKKVNQDAIYLPMPQSINMSDGWQWETVSFQKTALGELIKGDGSEALQKAFQDLVGGVSGKLTTENADKLIQHNMRRVVNPRKETMFSEPNMRTYSFEFDFAPRTTEESGNAQAIINLFKYHAAPELYQGDNALYNYPSEFQVYFVSNGKENNYIGKMDRCALTNIAVNYTNANMWSAFKDTGAPTHVKVTLELTELSLQSRNSLKKMDGD